MQEGLGIVGKHGVETHFVKRLSAREQLIRKVEIVPVEVVVRNLASGSLVKRLGGKLIDVKDGDQLPAPLIEYYLKEDALNDPIISADHITLFGLASPEELQHINQMTMTVNDCLQKLFLEIGITLIDFKLEFGRLNQDDGRIILADEISPDNCRLWDIETGEKKDKDRFRQDLGGLIEAYSDIASRFGLDLSLLKENSSDTGDK